MVIIEILKMVSALCEAVFETPVTTKDLQEGFPRPCVYVEPRGTDIKGGSCGEEMTEDIDIRITVFGEETNKGYLDLLKAQEKLSTALAEPIIGNSFTIYPQDVSFDLDRDDMVCECEFTVVVSQSISKDGSFPLMQNLYETESDD